jgi:hypothetical protein
MAAKQDKALAEKLARLDYPDFEVHPGEDDITMLHIDGHLICSVLYALALEDSALKALIDETLEVH